MATDITMPRLSDSMEEGVVVKWLVAVGDSVEKGQPLVEIDTDKATMEYEAEVEGALLEIVVAEGEPAPIGALIARIGAPGESPPEDASPRRAGRGNASPIARRLALELGVDLSAVDGSGPGGMISKEDVQRAAGRPAPPAKSASARGEARIEQPTRLQQAVARHMVEGASAPTFAVEAEIDMGAVVALRADLAEGNAPSLNDFVVKAVALALREFPRLNASYRESGFELYSRVNVGIAVAAEDALLVPTIVDADTKPLSQITAETAELAAKVRDGTIAPAELDGGTFTVTNLGMFGASSFFPIINPPQAGILAVGAVARRPVIDEDGSVVAREVMNATLVCDHRIVYGAEAARFLSRVRELLERPDGLI